MTCRSDLCTQGRQPCPTPWHCGNGLRRIEPAALEQRDGGMQIEFADEPPSVWQWLCDMRDAAKVVAAVALAVAAYVAVLLLAAGTVKF